MDNYAPLYLESPNADAFAEDLATLLLPTTIPFLYKLQQMLDNSAKDEQMEAIVSWLPNNQCFKVHDKDAFVKEVLPLYFSKITKYKSFIRQLNSYGFESISRGGYFHKYFIRGERRYCKYITRYDSRSRGGVKKSYFKMNNIEDSPNHDGDLVMFHGKNFYFVDAIAEYCPQLAKLKPILPTNKSILPSPTRINKEFVKPRHSPFYKLRTPTEAGDLLKKIIEGTTGTFRQVAAQTSMHS